MHMHAYTQHTHTCIHTQTHRRHAHTRGHAQTLLLFDRLVTLFSLRSGHARENPISFRPEEAGVTVTVTFLVIFAPSFPYVPISHLVSTAVALSFLPKLTPDLAPPKLAFSLLCLEFIVSSSSGFSDGMKSEDGD